MQTRGEKQWWEFHLKINLFWNAFKEKIQLTVLKNGRMILNSTHTTEKIYRNSLMNLEMDLVCLRKYRETKIKQ